MASKSVLIQVGVLVCLGVFHACLADTPWVDLYRGRNYDDTMIQISNDIPDLAAKNFDDQCHSLYYHAVAILYEYRNYNAANPGGDYVTLSYLTSGSAPGLSSGTTYASTSSVRILGDNSGTSHLPSMTLFEKNNFGGLRTELITTNKAYLDYTDSMSIVLIGTQAWTFYEEPNYNGRGYCVTGAGYSTSSKFMNDSTAIGFSLSGKRSVEKGCWSRHGVVATEYINHYYNNSTM